MTERFWLCKAMRTTAWSATARAPRSSFGIRYSGKVAFTPVWSSHDPFRKHCVCNSSGSGQQVATTAPEAAAPDASKAAAAQPAAAATQYQSEEARFHAAYKAAYTMSQLFVKDRPEAVPVTEWDARRKKRDMEEITAAGKKRGKDPLIIQSNLEQLETILPNLINLHKMKASDWVTLSEDVTAAANKLIALKSEFPKADVFSIMASRPKTLLQSEETIVANARKVKALLSKAEDVDAIIQAVPELSDPVALSRSLGFLAASFPSQDPVLLLQENPQILLNLAESNMEDSAEYGEMTTKD